MYQIGDYVVSANEGVCKVTDVVTMAMPGRRDGKKCYVIVPEGQKSGKLYIPVDSDKHQVRPIMTREEVDAFLDEIAMIDETWIESDKQREQIYKEAIFSCDPRRLVSILRTMYLRGNQRAAEGKKVTTVDERYFRIAEKNLHSELAFVLGISMDEVMDIIKEKYGQAERM